MNPDFFYYWNIVKELIKDVAIYVMPIAAFIVSLVALRRSNECAEVKVQLSEVQQKLNEYDLELKKHELEKIHQQENKGKNAKIEARVIRIASGKYRLKVWNSGNATAYNINVTIPEDYQIIIMDDKIPYEYLAPGDSFEEVVIYHMQSASKFNIICSWENDQGESFTNEQLRSI